MQSQGGELPFPLPSRTADARPPPQGLEQYMAGKQANPGTAQRMPVALEHLTTRTIAAKSQNQARSMAEQTPGTQAGQAWYRA